MPDNITLPGTGAVLAFDDVDGVRYIRVKVAVGADGEAADISFLNRVPTEDNEVNQTLELILLELQKMNFQLSLITDEDTDNF